jgi:hypothetical protein
MHGSVGHVPLVNNALGPGLPTLFFASCPLECPEEKNPPSVTWVARLLRPQNVARKSDAATDTLQRINLRRGPVKRVSELG